MDVINFITVTLYGNILMLLFTKEKKNRLQIFGIIAIYIISGLSNFFLWKNLGRDGIYMLYPFTVHLPLLIYYIFVVKTSVCEAVFALTAAYMLTTPRKWLCIFFAYLLGGGTVANAVSEVAISAALVLLIAKFAAPIVVKIFKSNRKEANYLCFPPAAAYIITYATTVYSDILFSCPSVSIPVLTTVLSVFFIGFEVCFFNYSSDRTNKRHNKEMLDLQLRFIEKLAMHMDAGEIRFCENKTLNAFLAMYKAAAQRKNICFVCVCNLPEDINVCDILVALTGMMDDALLNAEKYIRLEIMQKNGQICIMIKSDGPGVYDGTMLATLHSVIAKNKGIIYTSESEYKIQLSVKK